MARFTAIQVRHSGKLSLVLVLVAVHAFRKLNFEKCVLALGDVALIALHLRMLALQRVGAGGVFLDRKSGRLEALHRVAGCALRSARPFDELSAVHVLVTVRAFLESQRFLEVGFEVAQRTFDRLVLALQRVLGFGVIKFFIHRLQRHALPAVRIVAGLATLLLKAALVRIGVAIVALAESQKHPARLVIRSWGVALLAGHLRVQSGQRIFRPGVIELRDVFPILEVVTLLAVLSQAAIVGILVAGSASLRNPQEGFVRVPDLNAEPLVWSDMLRAVTFVTGQAGVFSEQVVAGFAVVEAGRCWRPLDNWKIHPVMLGVALGALLA